MIISEKQVLDAIASVLMENRKVLKIGSQTPSAPPVPDMSMQQPMQDTSMGMGPMMGQSGPAGGPGDPGMMDPNMGGDPNGDMGNQFDTNFDAGVEADEETDPKHYIQQLTGKLSQSINSFNSEQGADAGLCKYVASMIIAATCKNLDDKAKKELIEKINNASSDEEMPDDSQEEMDDDMGGDGNMENGGQEPPMDDSQQQMGGNMMEMRFTKKKLMEMFGMGDDEKERQDNLPNKIKTNKKTIFNGKTFR